MIHGKKALLALVLGLLLILGGCAGNQGAFTGRVEQISDWSLVAREPEEGKAYTFWARETSSARTTSSFRLLIKKVRPARKPVASDRATPVRASP